VQVPYGQGLGLEPLASRKVVYREISTEGSDPAKLGTEEHEPHKRQIGADELAHHNEVPNTKVSLL